MSRTLGDMRTAVRLWIGAGTDERRLPDSVIDDCVSGILRDLSITNIAEEVEEDWHFITVAGTREYDKPSDLSRVHTIWIGEYESTGTDPNGGGKAVPIGLQERLDDALEFLSVEVFDNKYMGSSDTAKPTEYTMWGSKIILGSVPDTQYDLLIRYIKAPEVMTQATDTNVIMTRYWDVIMQGVLAESCRYLIEDQRIAVFKDEYDRRKRRIQIEQKRNLHSGTRLESEEPS